MQCKSLYSHGISWTQPPSLPFLPFHLLHLQLLILPKPTLHIQRWSSPEPILFTFKTPTLTAFPRVHFSNAFTACTRSQPIPQAWSWATALTTYSFTFSPREACSVKDSKAKVSPGNLEETCDSTDTFHVIEFSHIPADPLKEVYYRKIVCKVCPKKADPDRTRITIRICYQGT